MITEETDSLGYPELLSDAEVKAPGRSERPVQVMAESGDGDLEERNRRLRSRGNALRKLVEDQN